jgi:ribosomal protein S10
MRCVNGDHYYVRATVNRVPVTYQLTREGQRRLSEEGLGHQDLFEWAVLIDLIDRGWAFTGGSRASRQLRPIEGIDWDPSDPVVTSVEPGPPHRLEERVWLWLEGSDGATLDTTVGRVMTQFQAANGSVEGPYPFPTRSEEYIVLAADGRRAYTIQTHKRALVVVDPTPAMFAAVRTAELPAGISVRLRQSASIVEVVGSDGGA